MLAGTVRLAADNPGRMSPRDFEQERARIRETYGDSSAEAAALRDQALAALFYRSGWTQEQLAKAENKSAFWVSKRLLFGRFLGFLSTDKKLESVPRNLSERRFRSYWEQTDKAEGNERIRFAEVQRLMEETTVVRQPRRNGLGKRIVAEFGDGGWHRLETIAEHTGETPESLLPLLDNFAARHNSYGVGICERKKVGRKDGTWQFRIVPASGTAVDVGTLNSELEPILKELEYQGEQHRAAYSPSAVLQCAHRIRKLLETLAQRAAHGR
jgi:hypothetical protein